MSKPRLVWFQIHKWRFRAVKWHGMRLAPDIWLPAGVRCRLRKNLWAISREEFLSMFGVDPFASEEERFRTGQRWRFKPRVRPRRARCSKAK